MKILKRLAVSILAFFVLIVVGFSIWAYTPAKPLPAALQSVESAEVLDLGSGKSFVFMPKSEKPKTGLIFYPGGRVDYRAYSPMAEELAKAGYLVIIPRMPFNLAVFGYDRAADIIPEYPTITNWVIGGHSLGGSMAAHYLIANQNFINGLVLVASYPAQSDNLTDYSGLVTSISGSLDGLAKPADIQASKKLLPPTTKFVEIAGGNHAQFGWYGPQAGDNPTTISRDEQQKQLIAAIIELLKSAEK